MRLLAADRINEVTLAEPNREDGKANYVKRLVNEGPSGLVSNLHASARALEIDGRLIPLVLSDGNPEDATVCSLESHYVESPFLQLRQLRNRLHSALARPFLCLLRCVIRAGRLGRAVYLNEWLMTTNPEAQLSASQIDKITNFLISQFPDRAIVFRSINQLTRPNLQRALVERGYSLVRSRRIYVFDSSRPDFRMKKNLLKDLRLLERWSGTIKGAPLDEEGIQRVAELYRGLYLRKYSSGNPEFTNEFFRTVINEGLFEFRYLEQNGEILAFTAWKLESDSMLGTLVGYDLDRPQEIGLLRMAYAIDFSEALNRRMPYHISSGAGEFKRLRGAVPTTEYDAIFSGHLDRQSHSFWTFFRGLMWLAGRIEGEEIDFKKAPELRRLSRSGSFLSPL